MVMASSSSPNLKEHRTTEVTVVIVGAGPAGLAMSACLRQHRISNIILEREESYASLWKKKTFDRRLKLHLHKQYCELPYMHFPPETPSYIPKKDFIAYLDKYVATFRIKPRYNRCVTEAFYNEETGKWKVLAHNKASGSLEGYVSEYMVVATGETSDAVLPEIPGLDDFEGEYLHSSAYSSGTKYSGKEVLVVGSGNSGMEIAHDLSHFGAAITIVVRSPIHVLTKDVAKLAMSWRKYLPIKMVDKLLVRLAELKLGDLSKYGIERPKEGPFYIKATKGRSPTIDVGCIKKIKDGKIKVVPSIRRISGRSVEFTNDKIKEFDAIIFATGYKSSVLKWLEDNEDFNEKGMPKRSYPNHWKGQHGLYCVGFGRQGLQGISVDAGKIAEDIGASLVHKTYRLHSI